MPLNWMHKKHVGPIGLDIGSEGIRMLQLCSMPDRLQVLAAARHHFAPNALAALDAAGRRQMLSDAIGRMLAQKHFKGRSVVSCLRTDELCIKNIRLQHLEEPALSQAALWECKERFSFPVTADRLHVINAGEVRQGAEVRDEILLISASETAVNDHVAMLAQVKLSPEAIDVEPNALFRAYQRFLRRAEDSGAVSVIIDVGLSSTKVIISRGKTILLVKGIDVAGQKFNETVAKGLNLSYADAVHLRRRGFEDKPGTGPAPDQIQWSVFDAIRSQVEVLAHEISLCLRYCSVTFRGLRPGQITLTGGEAHDPSLVKLLSEQLNCPCVVGEPLRNVELGDADMDSDRRSVLTEWSVATGLALRGLPMPAGRRVEHERHRLSA